MSSSGWSGAAGCNRHKSNDDLFEAADDQFESVENTAHLPAVDQPPAVKSSYMKKIEQCTSQS